jgi:hypothetical protein
MRRESKAQKRRRECERKTTYPDRSVASAVANAANGRPGALGHNGNVIAPYRCRWCGGWHIGHEPSQRGRSDPDIAARGIL